jgi:2,4-dienoyl-CoA reductase-like NADH-dependent reductase (Old Yellow Enzyme family)
MPVDSPLFAAGRIGPLQLRNRTIRSAAFEGCCPEGRPSPALLRYHQSVAAGGIGMTTVAYAAVTPGGRTFGHQMWMHEELIPELRKLTDAVHREGAAAAIQLGDGGNMADPRVIGHAPVAPSAVFNLFGLVRPRAMTEADLEQLLDAFEHAVKVAVEAGFDAVELQAGHGYLLSQFLSPHTNRRDDRWGGSLENRARLPREALRRMRRAAGPDRAVVVKTNLRDGFKGGLELDEAIEVARMLEADGADALILSGGFVSKTPWYLLRGEIPVRDIVRSQPKLAHKIGLTLFGRVILKSYPFEEAYFFEDALKVRAAVKLPLVLVGGLRRLETMERVLGAGMDFCALARPLLIEPDFVNRLARGESTTSPCEPCNRCIAIMYYQEAVCTEKERLLGHA